MNLVTLDKIKWASLRYALYVLSGLLAWCTVIGIGVFVIALRAMFDIPTDFAVAARHIVNLAHYSMWAILAIVFLVGVFQLHLNFKQHLKNRVARKDLQSKLYFVMGYDRSLARHQ